MTDLTPEQRAAYRSALELYPRGVGIPPDHLLALLDAADERDRLRDEISASDNEAWLTAMPDILAADSD